MPVIAVTRCSTLPDYEASVSLAGGTPWVVDQVTADQEDVMGVANGLLLTGSGGVNPSCYGEASRFSFSATETGRDQYEIDLVRRALEADLPVFAICRGIQVLNISRGGTLVQDISTEVADSLEHRPGRPALRAGRARTRCLG